MGAGVPCPVQPKSQTQRSAMPNPNADGIAASHRHRAVPAISTEKLSHRGKSQNHSAKNAEPTVSEVMAVSQLVSFAACECLLVIEPPGFLPMFTRGRAEGYISYSDSRATRNSATGRWDQLLQPSSGFVQRLGALAERKSHLAGTVPRIVVEARTRHGRYPDLFHEMLGELDIVRKSECTHIRHHVISSARLEATQSGFGKRWHQTIAAGAIGRRETLIIGGRQPQSRSSRFL